eukprot:TRINITY_DN25830_c0_g1_i1.p1 TRINITY_DN25830_c0_g1~~TRINITY_DN25830_c0_g1_i1.p1  ORF type:complete len:380 (-),score=95.96 TRINITY_DN25830_c0_g1_i1:72-1211(-)
MIYIFEGCKEICELPGKACSACSEAELCKPCQTCCAELGNNCRDFTSRPLGLYVFSAALMSIAELACCIAALAQDSFKHCVLPEGLARQVGMGHWLKVQMGCAWLNLIFAPYIQYQLMQKLQERAAQGGEVDQSQVKEAFVEVFLYDIGVCLYVFALVASFVWSFMGSSWLAEASATCDPGGWVSNSAVLGMVFFWGLLFYSAVWYLYISCTSSMPVRWARAAQYMAVEPEAGTAAASTASSAFSRAKGFVAAAAGGVRGTSSTPAPAAAPAPPPAQSGCQKACTVSQLSKLLACIGLDFFGSSSYFLPGMGEGVDLAYAPVQAIALKMLFQSNMITGVGFLEELLPFTDVLPTATIAWCIDTFCGDSCLGKALGFRQS